MQPLGSVTGVVIYKGKHAHSIYGLWTLAFILFYIYKVYVYGLALKFYVEYNNLHFTLWYSAYIIVVCCISCFRHDCLDCHLFFNSYHKLELLLVCYENLELLILFIHNFRDEEHKQNQCYSADIQCKLVSFRSTIPVHSLFINFVHSLLDTNKMDFILQNRTTWAQRTRRWRRY